jgi:hypothetical protein
VERLIGYARQRHDDGADAWVVQHIRDPESAESLEACQPIFGHFPLYVSEVGPLSRERSNGIFPAFARLRRTPEGGPAVGLPYLFGSAKMGVHA